MARIEIFSERTMADPPAAQLDDPDEDGLYAWYCNRGHASDRRMNVADAVNDAKVHVDHQCEGR